MSHSVKFSSTKAEMRKKLDEGALDGLSK